MQCSLETLAGDMNSRLAVHERKLQQLEAGIEDHEAKLKDTASNVSVRADAPGCLPESARRLRR